MVPSFLKMQTFEQLLTACQALGDPYSQVSRQVTWVDTEQVVGLARQPSGSLEIFICCERLFSASLIVRRHLEYDEWLRANSIAFPANRIVLPAAQHFVPVAAFIVEELLRRDVLSDPVRAFHETEPIIEMALRRLALSIEQVLGLLGELRLLDALLACAEVHARRTAVIDAWLGCDHTSRDFQFGSRAIEVKTTTAEISRHHIAGIRQTEPDRDERDSPVEQLFLVSFGFEHAENATPDPRTFSLPDQVERILRRLSGMNGQRTPTSEAFLDKLSRYGTTPHHGYIHDEMRNWSAYQGRWRQRFVRIYDMGDSQVKVIRARNVSPCVHVDIDSITYDVMLPDQINGDLNPTRDILAFAVGCFR